MSGFSDTAAPDTRARTSGPAQAPTPLPARPGTRVALRPATARAASHSPPSVPPAACGRMAGREPPVPDAASLPVDRRRPAGAGGGGLGRAGGDLPAGEGA